MQILKIPFPNKRNRLKYEYAESHLWCLVSIFSIFFCLFSISQERKWPNTTVLMIVGSSSKTKCVSLTMNHSMNVSVWNNAIFWLKLFFRCMMWLLMFLIILAKTKSFTKQVKTTLKVYSLIEIKLNVTDLFQRVNECVSKWIVFSFLCVFRVLWGTTSSNCGRSGLTVLHWRFERLNKTQFYFWKFILQQRERISAWGKKELKSCDIHWVRLLRCWELVKNCELTVTFQIVSGSFDEEIVSLVLA